MRGLASDGICTSIRGVTCWFGMRRHTEALSLRVRTRDGGFDQDPQTANRPGMAWSDISSVGFTRGTRVGTAYGEVPAGAHLQDTTRYPFPDPVPVPVPLALAGIGSRLLGIRVVERNCRSMGAGCGLCTPPGKENGTRTHESAGRENLPFRVLYCMQWPAMQVRREKNSTASVASERSSRRRFTIPT